MKPEQSEQNFLLRVRSALDESANHIDEATSAQLASVRQRAVNASVASRSPNWLAAFYPRWRTPQQSLAAAIVTLVIVAAVTLMVSPARSPNDAAAHLEDLELLSSSDDLELYQNLDFYLWLEDEQPQG